MNFSDYKDEPEDGEEISEDRESATEDTFSYRSVKSSMSESTSDVKEPPAAQPVRKPVKKIDLGAAATLISVPPSSSQKQRAENGIAPAELVSDPPAQEKKSAMNDLVDLMNTGPTDAPLMPTSTSSNQEDLFGGFSSAPTHGMYR